VRLKYDDVEKVPKKKPTIQKNSKKPSKGKKLEDWNGSDFDSEEEYGNEGAAVASEDDENAEYDDGKDHKNAPAAAVDDSGSESEGDYGSELGEDEMSEAGESEIDSLSAAAESDGKEEPFDDDGEDGLKEEYVHVKEDLYTVDPFMVRREATLLQLVRRQFNQRCIIFFNEKLQCSRAHVLFAVFGLKSVECHGNMSQTLRMEAIEKFQRGEVDFLLATDLVARGLDINGVRTVLNFSFPTEPKRYLHRVGRTARAGGSGVSVTLCNDEERKDIKKLARKMQHNMHVYNLPASIIKEMHTFI
jgi:superfamily II DNA or RNA helicase